MLPSALNLKRVPLYLITYAISLMTLFPVYYMIDTALKTEAGYARSSLGLAHHVTWVNFVNAWQNVGLNQDLWHSAIVTIGGVLLCLAVVTMAGYALSQMPFRRAQILLLVMVAFLMVTPPVIIVPLYMIMIHAGLVNTYLGIILAYAALFTPFGVYMTTAFFREIPKELFEAAAMDGAGPVQRFMRVLIPLGYPAIVTLGVLLFVWIWNDLLYALLMLQDNSHRTAMVAIEGLIGQYNVPMPELAAALLIAMIPTILVFILFQSRLEKGLTMGAVK